MKKRMGSLVASTAALTVLSLISAGGGFSSAGASPSTPGPDGLVAQATSTGTAVLLGTSTLAVGATEFGGGALGTTPSSSGLPASIPAGDGPRTPDAGTDASGAAKAPASLSTSQGRGHPSGVPYSTVAGNPVVGASSGLTSTPGLNAFDQGITHPQGGGLPGVDVEPSDQGLCASSTNKIEINNTVIYVYSGSSTTPETLAPLESLFNTPEIFGADGPSDPSLSIQGDPRCFYDNATGRWYASQLWLDEKDGTPQGWAGTYLAVSQTSDPIGTWNVYFIPDLSNQSGTSTCNNLPASSANSNPCFGDQPLLGVDGNSVQISTNEYSIFGNAPAGLDNYYFLSKSAVDSGAASVPVWWNALGSDVSAPGGAWYSVDPAQSPDGNYLSANGGTSYALSSLDFTNAGDSRIAEWAFTNTSAVDSSGSIGIYEVTLSSNLYGLPPLAAQKSGPTPLGNFWNVLNGAKSKKPLPEGPIQTNDDRMTTAAFDSSTGALIGALNTGVNQAVGGKSSRPYTGVAYFVVTPTWSSTGLEASTLNTGYISPSGANAFFPAVSIAPNGNGVINYVLTGTGYYPSTAYSLVSANDTVSSTVHVAAAGAGPQDGFTEYEQPFDPRWGDYSGSQVVGNTVVFAGEMINQSCTNAQFQADFTCGNTRDLFINWGTSVNWITP